MGASRGCAPRGASGGGVGPPHGRRRSPRTSELLAQTRRRGAASSSAAHQHGHRAGKGLAGLGEQGDGDGHHLVLVSALEGTAAGHGPAARGARRGGGARGRGRGGWARRLGPERRSWRARAARQLAGGPAAGWRPLARRGRRADKGRAVLRAVRRPRRAAAAALPRQRARVAGPGLRVARGLRRRNVWWEPKQPARASPHLAAAVAASTAKTAMSRARDILRAARAGAHGGGRREWRAGTMIAGARGGRGARDGAVRSVPILMCWRPGLGGSGAAAALGLAATWRHPSRTWGPGG
jgi:hypothetical protein